MNGSDRICLDAVLDGEKRIAYSDSPSAVYLFVKNNRKWFEDRGYSVFRGQRAETVSIDTYLAKLYDGTQAASLKEVISKLPCVRSGWEDGVPVDVQEMWLDDVVKAVREHLRLG